MKESERLNNWLLDIKDYLMSKAGNEESKQRILDYAGDLIGKQRMSLALGISVNQLEKRLNPIERIPKPRKPKVKQ